MPKMKTIIGWLLFVFIVFAILTQPDRAASIVGGAWNLVVGGVESIVRFFNHLLGGKG